MLGLQPSHHHLAQLRGELSELLGFARRHLARRIVFQAVAFRPAGIELVRIVLPLRPENQR